MSQFRAATVTISSTARLSTPTAASGAAISSTTTTWLSGILQWSVPSTTTGSTAFAGRSPKWHWMLFMPEGMVCYTSRLSFQSYWCKQFCFSYLEWMYKTSIYTCVFDGNYLLPSIFYFEVSYFRNRWLWLHDTCALFFFGNHSNQINCSNLIRCCKWHKHIPQMLVTYHTYLFKVYLLFILTIPLKNRGLLLPRPKSNIYQYIFNPWKCTIWGFIFILFCFLVFRKVRLDWDSRAHVRT